ncbi:SDR family NAD(P)-dependent oxidoreductase [Actinoplanes sp. NPDC000266]
MKYQVDYRGRTALITGASAGIGAAFARGLAARGCDVVLVARREDRLKALAAEVEQNNAVTATVVAADLSANDAPARIFHEVQAQGIQTDILVNNAGFGIYGRFETFDPARDLDLVMVNVAAYVGMTHQFLPGMIERGDGVVINVSSAAAFQALPYQITYAASKAFVQSFSDGLWAENQGSGVRVVSCAPAATDTEYFEVIGNDEEARFGPKRPPEGVVADTLRALDRGRMYTVVGAPWKVMANVPRLLPRTTYAKICERMTRPRRAAA